MAAINRRRFLKMGCAGVLGTIYGEVWGRPAASPNILLIVADDLGYGDVSCYGGAGGISTPHIDSLAAEGTRFTNAYSCSPVCMPSRIGLLTGVHPCRLGFHFNVSMAGAKPSLAVPMLSETLGAHGYHTGCIGKWGMGTQPGFTPRARGFDFFYGFVGSNYDYQHKNARLRLNGRTAPPRRCTTRAFTQAAVRFIRRASVPWFLLLSYRAPHTPYYPELAHRREFRNWPSPRREYAASVRGLDDGVGAVLRALRDGGQQENTLVVFLSDNGGAARPAGASHNAHLRGGKATVYEGGIRVPFIVRYPQVGNTVCDRHDPVSTLDVAPTALALALIDSPVVLDGHGLRNEPMPNRTMYWQVRTKRSRAWAVRQGNWKLVRERDQSLPDGPWPAQPRELFDLTHDPYETRSVIHDHPKMAAALEKKLTQWAAGLPARPIR